MLVAVELCSLTVQRDDVSVANLVASGLFGDGAAAVVARGVGRDTPLAARRAARCWPPAAGSTRTPSGRWAGTSRSTGLRIVLDAEVPNLVERYVRDDVDGFLADHGLTRDDIGWWVCHPGGPKVIEAIETALDAARARRCSSPGTRSPGSATCRRSRCCTSSRTPSGTVRRRPARRAILMAMGPGFCLEMVLLEAAA